RFVKPDLKSFRAAAANTKWENTKDFYTVLTDRPGADAWPILGVTFILMHKIQREPETARRALDFFSWSYRNGGKMADELSYVPMPGSVVELIRREWKQEFRGRDGKPL
ncbi:MAG: phosphate ABC transporter substrate-binding protein PstS, partial [Syntrophobacteraceae bacterium]